MKILIEVSDKDFGVDINDKFQDFFERIMAEIGERLIAKNALVCGNYEKETVEMFLNAFKNALYISENASNGEVIKELFPNVKTRGYIKSFDFIEYTFDGIVGNTVEKSWWDTPYKTESEE